MSRAFEANVHGEGGVVEVRDGDLYFQGKLLAAARGVRAVLPGGPRAPATLWLRVGPLVWLRIHLRSRGEAEELARSLGHADGEPPIDVPLWRAPFAHAPLIALSLASSIALLALLFLVVLRLAAFGFVFFWAFPGWQPGWLARVSRDGVSIAWLGSELRRLAWSDVARVERAPWGALLVLQDGAIVTLRLPPWSDCEAWVAAIRARATTRG